MSYVKDISTTVQSRVVRASGMCTRFKTFFAILFLIVCCSIFGQTKRSAEQNPATSPQTERLLYSYEGQKVTSIELAGRPELNANQFTPLFAQHAGEPFSREKVEQTVRALKEKGKFDEVQVQVDPQADGVRILLVLEPAVYFGLFEFPGAERFAYSRLVQVANYPPQAPFNADEIVQDQNSLINFFREQGYFEAEVRPEVKVDQEHGLANVIFHVSLSRRARFGTIEVVGIPAEQAASLGHSLQSFMARARGAAIRSGKTYNRTTLSNATKYLQSKLEKNGRLAAQVQLAGAEYHAPTNRADIHFEVHPGPLIHVEIKGAHLWSWTRKSLLPIYQGVGVDPELVQEGRQALLSYFQGKGYFDVKVDSDFRTEDSTDIIVYQISKEKKHKVTDVTLSGNSQLNSSDLMSHIAVEKKHLFSPGKFSEALVRTSVKNLEAVYKSNGFSSVKVTSTVVNGGADIRVIFHVDEGPRDEVAALRIEGADTLPQSMFAPGGLKLGPGRPYSQQLVQEDRTNITAHYLQSGYLTARFRETASPVSKSDPHHINVVYHIYEGPRVYTANVVTLGRQHIQQRLIDRDVGSIKPGQPLTETQLLTAESKLYDHTGVFDWAEVDPRRQITTQTKEDVLVKVHESRKNQITYGFGFEIINRGGSVPSGTVALPNLPPIGLPSTFTTSQKTFYGPRGTFQYTRNNVRGKGESISFTAFAGRLDQRGAAYYIDPNLRWTRWSATGSLSIEKNEENPVYSSRVGLGSYQIQRFLGNGKANVLFLRYSFSKTDLTRIEIPQLVLPQDQHVRLSTIAANITRDTRDNPLDAHKGLLESVELNFNTTKLGSSVNFAKLTSQAAYYKQIPHDIVWANSIRIGLAQPFAGSRVPLSEAFFTGGGNTLRGFPLDGAGPQRQVPVCSGGSSTNCTLIQVPSGGNELLILNSELRIPLPIKKGLGIVTFYDGGNVFPKVGFHDFTSLYSNNVGVGLRYATPVGPVRIDVGRNLNPIPGIKATQYFVSIGQAF
ncbi:MAG TPA: POTRA domain-containing protein [Acidobacteriaceae bacterium]